MLADLGIKDFLDRTASAEPLPGGGSAAALGAALAASLSEMVANLTIGKKGYESSEQEMREIAKKSSAYRKQFVEAIDRDSDAYNQVMAAFRLPRNTLKEKNEREQQIQEALKQAARVPLEVAKHASEIMDLVQKVVERGNKNAATDGMVAGMLARTAVLSALCNVKINLASINDKEFAEDMAKEMMGLESKVARKEKKIRSLVPFP